MRWFNPGGSNGYRGVFTTKVLSTNSFAFNNPVYDDSKNVTVTSPSGYNLVNALWGRGTFFTIHRSPLSGEANNQEMMISTDGTTSFQFFNTKARYFGNNWTTDFGSDAENTTLYQFRIEYTFNLRQEFVDINITVRQYKKSDGTVKGTLVKQVRSYDGVNFPLRNTFPLRYWQGVQAGSDYWCVSNSTHPLAAGTNTTKIISSANGKNFNGTILNMYRMNVDNALGNYTSVTPITNFMPAARLNGFDAGTSVTVTTEWGNQVDLFSPQYTTSAGFLTPGSTQMLFRFKVTGPVSGTSTTNTFYVVVDRNLNFVREFSTDTLFQAINPAYPTGMVNATFLISGNPDSDTLIAQPWFQNAANQYNSDGVMSKTFRSTDFGVTWNEITPANYIPYTSYYPQTPGRFIRYVGKRTWQLDYQGNVNYKFVSKNDGATWELVQVQPNGLTDFVLPNDMAYATVVAT